MPADGVQPISFSQAGRGEVALALLPKSARAAPQASKVREVFLLRAASRVPPPGQLAAEAATGGNPWPGRRQLSPDDCKAPGEGGQDVK